MSNARLIAAAPTMLALLATLCDEADLVVQDASRAIYADGTGAEWMHAAALEDRITDARAILREIEEG
jgi:hypothetical protein